MSDRTTGWLHVGALAALSASYESFFLRFGLNVLDEGWPLYAAMQLQRGGVLYGDVFFVFPPGHLLAAWLAHALAPPGVVLARAFYAAFSVALCVVLYLLGRRLMPPPAALLGAGLLAVAAPDSHGFHYLFGYRYMVWSALAMLCFAQRARTGDVRWMLASGVLTGVALVFRLTPALAVTAGLGAGVLALHPDWRSRLRDGALFGAGALAVALPVFALFAAPVGWETLWREVVVRPVVMTELQSLPPPPLELAEWSRLALRDFFVAAQFRLYALLYAGYALVLAPGLLRALWRGRAFEWPLLLAVVVWGGVFFLRSFGRADEAHLDSTIPVTCLLLAHAVGLPLRRALARGGAPRLRAQLVLASVLVAWVFLSTTDRYLMLTQRPGSVPLSTVATSVRYGSHTRVTDILVHEMRARTAPDAVVLDVSGSALLHVLAERRGPGAADVLMPGTFLDREEEQAFLARLEADPPSLVIVPRWIFDGLQRRMLRNHAAALTVWIRRRYEAVVSAGEFQVLAPRATPFLPGARPEPAGDARSGG